MFFAVSSMLSASTGNGSSGEPAGISTETFVCVVSVSPLTSTLESTSTLTVSPLTESCSTVEAASSSADCNASLAALALAILASLTALLCLFLDEATEPACLAGEAILLGDADLVDLDFDPLETEGGGRMGFPGN